MSRDGKFFHTTKKGTIFCDCRSEPAPEIRAGEIHELKEELDSPKEDKKRDAVKKVIAAMTVGKDVSMLFTDVVKCMQTQNLELKKLVYLYIMNYAKSNPDLAILAVNTFVQVTHSA
jgi:AP-1 complex subunit beta-1